METRLHVVTGKGGTGKSSVAAALALALASEGKTVLLCEVEGRQGIAQLFDVAPLPYLERRIAKPKGELFALAIDAESALMEYLAMYYHLGRAGKALDRFGVIDFATTIAPGVRDVLLTGKVYEAVKRNARNKGARTYDAVVLDAPPTGRIAQFLGVNEELADLAKVGPIKAQADSVAALMRGPATKIHLVTVLEEMPVQETADAVEELSAAGLNIGTIFLNMVRPQVLDAPQRAKLAKVATKSVADQLTKVGLDPNLAEALIEEGRFHGVRRQLEDQQRALVSALGKPVVELPLLADGVDAGGLLELAALIEGEV
ncbi:MAG: ArsA-related P-loop ATPase [Marmoricola sp.]